MPRRILGLLLVVLLSQVGALTFYLLVGQTMMHRTPLISAASRQTHRNDVHHGQQKTIKDDEHVDKSDVKNNHNNGTDNTYDVDNYSNDTSKYDDGNNNNNNNSTKHDFKNSTKDAGTDSNGIAAMAHHSDVSNASINNRDVTSATKDRGGGKADATHDVKGRRPVNESESVLPVLCHTFSDGRLGNHFFEYASLLGLAQSTGRTVYFLNDKPICQALRHPPRHAHSDVMKARCKNAQRLHERVGGQYDRRLVNLKAGKDYYIGEYLQSWIYFHHISPYVMRNTLAFNDDIMRNASRVLDVIRASRPNTTLVGVHVRRGDLALASLRRAGYLTATPEYFARAMTYFRQRFSGREGGVTFVVLGEDREWSLDNIRAVEGDVIFPKPSSNPAVDMQVLSSCQHMIRTVGTFGWWAAYKLEGRASVVYLKNFMKLHSEMSSWYSKDAHDFLLPGWIGM